MAAYMVAEIEVEDAEAYEAYKANVGATLVKFGGKFLSRGGKSTIFEGEWRSRMVLIEFPSKDEALAWYNDAEYQNASQFRRLASKGRMLLQEGGSNTANPDPKL